MEMAIVRSIKVEILEVDPDREFQYRSKSPPEYRDITDHPLIGKRATVDGARIGQQEC